MQQFFWNCTAAFSDGLANVVLYSEKRCGSARSRFVVSQSHRIETDLAVIEDREIPMTHYANKWHLICEQADERSRWYTGQGTNWAIGDDANYNHLLQPNSNVTDCGAFAAPITGARKASSYHSFAVNVLYGDGHTSEIADDIDIEVWRSLGARSDGETLSALLVSP